MEKAIYTSPLHFWPPQIQAVPNRCIIIYWPQTNASDNKFEIKQISNQATN